MKILVIKSVNVTYARNKWSYMIYFVQQIIDSDSKAFNFQSTNIFFVIFGFYYIVCNGNFGPLEEYKKTTILEC